MFCAQNEYLSLYMEISNSDAPLTKLWAELNDIASNVSFHQQKKSEIEHRLDDSDESLTGPAIDDSA